MAALFDRADREHIDIKFCVNAAVDIESEDFCREAANMLDQMDAGAGADETFSENFESREVEEILASV